MIALPRKSIAALIAAIGIILVVAWLSLSPQEADNPQPALSQTSAATDTRQLRLGLNIAAGSALHAAAEKFAVLVHERSAGKLKIVVFPDQQLGTDDQMLEMAREGKLDLLLTPTAKLSSAIPAMQYADLPFYFSGRDELYAMLDGEPGQLLLAKLGSINLVGLTFWENGFKQLTANKPIRRPADLSKLRMRTMKSALIADQFSSLGAQPIPIDFHATYQALQDGAVDGQENPLVAIVGMRFHEVQKHLTLSNHAYLGYVFSASKTVFQTLSPEMREIIQQTARELTVWERAETARREAELLETIRKAGVEIHALSDEERQHFALAMAPIVEKFAFTIGYDLLAKTEELRLKQNLPTRETGKQPWLLGLNADLSGRGQQAGGAIYRGIQMALDEINQQGGILGRPVKLIARDHGASPQSGRKNLQYFADMPSLLAIIGGMHSAVIHEELEDIHRQRIPYLIPWAAAQGLTAHDYKPNYTFRVSISDAHIAPYLFEQAMKQKGPVAILLERSAWGRSNEAALKPLIEKLPAEMTRIEWINTGEANIELLIERLSRDGYRSLVLVSNGIEAEAVVKAMAKQEKPLPIFAHWALIGGDFWEKTRNSLKKVDLRFVQSILEEENSQHPGLKTFLQRYRQRYQIAADNPTPSLMGTIHAYDLTHLLMRAVGQAQSGDRAAIRNALESLRPYQGILQTYQPAFTASRHDALNGRLLHLARFDQRGRIVAAE